MTQHQNTELPGLKDAQKALAHELMNAGFSDAADYMMGDYMKAVMAEKLQPRPAKAVQGDINDQFFKQIVSALASAHSRMKSHPHVTECELRHIDQTKTALEKLIAKH